MSASRKPSDGLLGIVFRFFLFLLVMKFIYLDWLRLLVGPGGKGGREAEIAGHFDGFTRGPRFPAPGAPADRHGQPTPDPAEPAATPAPAPSPVNRNRRSTVAP